MEIPLNVVLSGVNHMALITCFHGLDTESWGTPTCMLRRDVSASTRTVHVAVGVSPSLCHSCRGSKRLSL